MQVEKCAPRALAVLGTVVLIATLLGCTSAEDQKRAHLSRGHAYAAEGDFGKARVEFKNAAKIDPKDSEARSELALALVKLGNYRAAIGQYLRVIADDPQHVGARVALGDLYLAGGQIEVALRYAEEALAIQPSADAYVLRASAFLAADDLERSLADAQAALAAEPDNVRAVKLNAGLRATRLDDPQDAIRLIEAARVGNGGNEELHLVHVQLLAKAGRHAEAVELLREYVSRRTGPARRNARLRLARYLDDLGRLDEAEHTYRETAAEFPEEVAPVLALARFFYHRRSPEDAERLLLSSAGQRESSAPYQEALADLYARSEESEKREAILQRMLSEHGTSGPGLKARSMLAQVRLDAGRHVEARALLETVLEHNPLDVTALSMSAKLSLLQGEYERAIGTLRTLLRDNPDAIEAVWLLGVAHRRNGEVKAAEAQFRRALEITPSALSARMDLVNLLGARGDTEGALELINQGLAHASTSLELLRLKGRLQSAANDWSGASETAMVLIREHANAPFGHQLQGMAAFAASDYRQAADAFQRAFNLEPERTEVLETLVRSLVADGRAAEAVTQLRATLSSKPEAPRLLTLLGSLLRNLGRIAEAKPVLERAIALAPASPFPYREFALVLESEDLLAQAASVLEKGLAATQGSELLLIELGRVLDLQGKPEAAIALYEKYLGRHPSSETTANNLAALLSTHRDDGASLDRAAALAERFRTSHNPAFLDTLGWAHHRRGESKRAVTILEEVLALSPGTPTFEYHLGAALIGAGEIDRGLALVKTSLSSRTRFPEREQARALVSTHTTR